MGQKLKDTENKNAIQGERRAKMTAFYLPQDYSIPENGEWWGQRFSEWTYVTKDRPLFPRQLQSKLPADLGFYDLRLPKVREGHVELSKTYGVEGFCSWHYWFGGGWRDIELN